MSPRVQYKRRRTSKKQCGKGYYQTGQQQLHIEFPLSPPAWPTRHTHISHLPLSLLISWVDLGYNRCDNPKKVDVCGQRTQYVTDMRVAGYYFGGRRLKCSHKLQISKYLPIPKTKRKKNFRLCENATVTLIQKKNILPNFMGSEKDNIIFSLNRCHL
jgi:hypothetical protein